MNAVRLRAAIEHYRRFLKFLQTEVADTPMSETTDLAERIKCGEQICRPEGRAARREVQCPLRPDGACPPHLSELLTLN